MEFSDSFSIKHVGFGVRGSRRQKFSYFPVTDTSGTKSTSPDHPNNLCCVIDSSPLSDDFIEDIISPENGPDYIVWSLDAIAERFEQGFDKPEETTTGRNSELTNSWTNTEHSYSAYLSVEIFGDLAFPYRADFGLRWVDTQLIAKGWKTQGDVGSVVATPTNIQSSHSLLLYNSNIALDLSDTTVLRFSASRNANRPPLNDLRSSESVGLNVIENRLQGRGGNPYLKPIVADQASVSFEQYSTDYNTAFFASSYYILLDSYPGSVTIDEERNGTTALITRTRQTEGGYLRGFELTFYSSSSFNRFGFQSGGLRSTYNYNETNIELTNNQPTGLVGFSKHTFNASLWLSSNSIDYRIGFDYRDDYPELDQFENSIDVRATMSLDARITYNVSRNLQFALDGSNLLDSTRRKYTANNTNRTAFVAKNGRSCTLRASWYFE